MKKQLLAVTLLMSLSLGACTAQKEESCSGTLVGGCRPVVYFESGSTTITNDSYQTLDWVKDRMDRWPLSEITITGYTDKQGDPMFNNMALSYKRAEAVKAALLKRGVDKSRVRVEYQGSTEPFFKIENGNELSRRVEITFNNKKRLGFF